MVVLSATPFPCSGVSTNSELELNHSRLEHHKFNNNRNSITSSRARGKTCVMQCALRVATPGFAPTVHILSFLGARFGAFWREWAN